MGLKHYRVTIRAKHPAWDDKPQHVLVRAGSKREANAKARLRAWTESGERGLTFSAVEVPESVQPEGK